MNSPITLFIFLCLLVSLMGCASYHSNMTNEHGEWMTKSPVDEFYDSTEQNILPLSHIKEVISEYKPKAEALLKSHSLLAISSTDAEKFIGAKPSIPPRNSAYLVRGICQHKEAGGFTCILYKRMLWVGYTAMGSRDYPKEKQPIVVYLETKPKKVFVTASMAK